MKNKLTIVFPTRPNIKNIKWLLWSLDVQTFQDFRVIWIVDSVLTQSDFDNIQLQCLDWLKNIKDRVHFVTNLNSDFVPQKWVSYVRNYWIKLADTEFINLFDDDELFDSDYLQKTFDLYNEIKSTRYLKHASFWTKWRILSKVNKDSSAKASEWQIEKWQFVLVPKIMYRKTWKIQNEWFDYYNFWTTRPHQFHFSGEKFAEIQMFSWNSLFGPTKIFQEILFDERFDFVYEDLEFTYRLHKSGYPIFITSELEIYHMERDKTKLEDAWIGSEFQCHRKARHRIWFVKKHATKIQNLQFYALWFWWQIGRLVLKIIIFAPVSQRWKLISAILRGTVEWMKDK